MFAEHLLDFLFNLEERGRLFFQNAIKFFQIINKLTPWPGSASELY
jgi:hypothetical protein